MTSKALTQSRFLDPAVSVSASASASASASLEHSIVDLEDQAIKARREATVYDAVAGRISSSGFIARHLVFSSTRDTPSSSASAAAPETVLFRRKNAPTRFAEHDIYFASEAISHGLPDPDLLKALHRYTSGFYARATSDGGAIAWRSMDETALIALGFLMEEVSHLGRTADLVFTEGAQVDESPNKTIYRQPALPATFSGASKRRPPKKRRMEKTNIAPTRPNADGVLKCQLLMQSSRSSESAECFSGSFAARPRVTLLSDNGWASKQHKAPRQPNYQRVDAESTSQGGPVEFSEVHPASDKTPVTLQLSPPVSHSQCSGLESGSSWTRWRMDIITEAGPRFSAAGSARSANENETPLSASFHDSLQSLENDPLIGCSSLRHEFSAASNKSLPPLNSTKGRSRGGSCLKTVCNVDEFAPSSVLDSSSGQPIY
ncbi:hypothetical protein G7Y89_g8976 [Cudoniella acicularis]|uniref:Uncharacterized protein n=1 Tax=Cudoniella acicularis TaxID=354080 RepID=A0A8H4W317_9HELO|nr:hypothetical protein G7Y89_g8976 [Cudoniella acicularis]